MWFRSLTLFRFSERTAKSLKSLEADLASRQLRRCGAHELSTRGFISPYGRMEEKLLHRLSHYALLTLGGEDRLLPNSVINDELASRLKKIAEKGRKKLGTLERRRLKEQVQTELLPRAFIRQTRLSAYLDMKNGWLALDTASPKAAEETVAKLRAAVGTFPAVPMAAEESPRALMTDWLIHGKLPHGLSLADECELRDPAEAGAIVRCRRQDLETDEVREHLKSGKQVFQLGLVFGERIGFVLGEDLIVRKLRFLDQVQEQLGETEYESAPAELDAQFALMTSELERLFASFEEWFGLPRPMDRR